MHKKSQRQARENAHSFGNKEGSALCLKLKIFDAHSLDFIGKTFGKTQFSRGEVIKGNFYKCGDKTEIPHFGMWSPIDSEKPNFHQPQFFGEMEIEK